MAQFYATETKTMSGAGRKIRNGIEQGARLRMLRATIPLDLPWNGTTESSTGTGIASGDTILLGTRDPGQRFAFGVITSSVSLGSSTVAVGTAASAAKYKAAATFTATDTPTMFGKVSAMDDGENSAQEDIIATIAAANLPTTAGAVLTIDLYFMGR